MTESQRDYLADLANRKGVKVDGSDELSVSRASEMIEELKSLPDAVFGKVSEAEEKEVTRRINAVLYELSRWGFVEGGAV